MNIIDNEPNTKITIKIEPPEQKVFNDIETSCMNLCENIKVEIVEHEVPVYYDNVNLRENFQIATNSNIEQKIKNGCMEVATNINKYITEKNILDIEPSKLNKEININKPPESDDELRNDLFYYCEICGVKYLSGKSLDSHMRFHDKSRKFNCNTCGYRFKSKALLMQHMLKHSEMMFECVICGYKSNRKDLFKKHMKKKHADIPADKNSDKKTTTNDISGSSQQNTTVLNKDNSQSHNKDGKLILYHQCNICDFSSFVKNTLGKHMKLHDINRKYQCDVCLYRFKTKQELSKHMPKHSNKKCSCRVCGRQFKYEQSVTAHMHVHEGVQYRCDMCGHDYDSKSQLSAHVSHKHNNIYKCHICLKTYTDNSNYSYHMKTHLKLKS